MEIYIKEPSNNIRFSIIVNEDDTVEDLKQKIIKTKFKEIPHSDHSFNLYNGILMESDKKLSYYDIKKFDTISLFFDVFISMFGAGYIDNLKEESKTPIAKKVGFNMNLIKRDELNINLIHFDLNMTNGENYKYFNNFKVDVVGGFYAMDDVNIFQKLLQKNSERKIPFLVVSSGSSGKEIIPICKEYPFIKEVIIFCLDYEHNKHYIDEYPGYVKKVITSIDELYDYLKKFYGQEVCYECHPDAPFQFEENNIQMDRQIQECPVITAEEYDKCYFLVHRAYSYFFDNFDSDNHSFSDENYKIIEDLLEKLSERMYFQKEDDKSRLSEIFKKLKKTTRYDIFVEETIRKYTGESIFCYLFNTMMRNIESGIIYLSYFMGPLIFELNKYVKNRKECAFSQNMTLYRKINCTETEFYLYKLNLHHIICFPALTSTSSIDTDFEPTKLAGEINKKDGDSLKVKLIINYNHENDNISPGIIIEDKKGYNNKYISCCPHEKEVLLFPFTFAKIVSIVSKIENDEEIKIVNLELINRKSYLEYILKDDVDKRPKFSDI